MSWRLVWLGLVVACPGPERDQDKPQAEAKPEAGETRGTSQPEVRLQLPEAKSEPRAIVREKPTITKDWALEQKVAIKHRMHELEQCFEQAKKAAAEAVQGTMTFELELDRGGDVTAVTFVEDTMGAQKMTTCVRARLLAWRLPVEPGIDPAPVTFTVVFSE